MSKTTRPSNRCVGHSGTKIKRVKDDLIMIPGWNWPDEYNRSFFLRRRCE